jgi:acyl-CoA thioester hydrolase
VKPYLYTFKVTKDAIDFNGHVNNVTYLAWMIEAATRHSESVGFGYETCLALGGTWVAKSHTIEYRKPAFEGEMLRMETWIEEIGRIMSVRRYVLKCANNGIVVCEGKTEWVFVDTEKMRPMKIPAVVIEGFKKIQTGD